MGPGKIRHSKGPRAEGGLVGEGTRWLGSHEEPSDFSESLYVLGSKLPLFPYNRGWSSTQ